jgi:hypothetical protein
MSSSSKKRTLRSLETLSRVRRYEEKKALRKLSGTRKALDRLRARLDALRETRQASGDSTAGGTGGSGRLLRERLFLDLLRRCERLGREDLACEEREWRDEQLHYAGARSRRRLVESLRDRRQRELEEELSREAERFDGGPGDSAGRGLAEDTCKP